MLIYPNTWDTCTIKQLSTAVRIYYGARMLRSLPNKSNSVSSSYSSKRRPVASPSHPMKHIFPSHSPASSFSNNNPDSTKYKKLGINMRAYDYHSPSVISYNPSTIHVVKSKSPFGCMVSSIAMAAGVDYDRAMDAVREIGCSLETYRGMVVPDAQAALAVLGISTTQRHQEKSWADFPNMAIVGVHGPNANHAVFFRRKNGVERVYDCNYEGSRDPGNYRLIENDLYLSIDGRLRT